MLSVLDAVTSFISAMRVVIGVIFIPGAAAPIAVTSCCSAVCLAVAGWRITVFIIAALASRRVPEKWTPNLLGNEMAGDQNKIGSRNH